MLDLVIQIDGWIIFPMHRLSYHLVMYLTYCTKMRICIFGSICLLWWDIKCKQDRQMSHQWLRFELFFFKSCMSRYITL